MITASYQRSHKILIAAGVLLWFMTGALFVQAGIPTTKNALESIFGVSPAAAIPQTFTTCGTYTQDTACGNEDCGQNRPFAPDGQIDPNCTSATTGNNICFNENPANGCFCQQATGSCSLPVTPTPVKSGITFIPATSSWQVNFEWSSAPATDQNCAIVFESLTPIVNSWKCIWGSFPDCTGPVKYCRNDRSQICSTDSDCPPGPPGTCVQGGSGSDFKGRYCEGGTNTWRKITSSMTEDLSWYFGVQSRVPASGRMLQSEIRQFDSFVQDFTVDVASPADTSIVTGEQSADYTVTVTSQGGATGQVALSVGNWSPSINGTTIVWAGGANTVTLPANGTVIKTFKIQTDDGNPPVVPPVTLPDVYSFRVSGQHATLGTKFDDVANGLTVQDYRFTTTATTITMDATGDTDFFNVNTQWLPSAQPFEANVTLSNTVIPNLTVSYANFSTPLNNDDTQFRVNLSTNNVAAGTYTFKVTGTGTNPGALVREVQITLIIAGQPDFTWVMSPAQITAPVGGNNFYTISAGAINSPPGGMVIQLFGEAFRWPSNPDLPPSVGLVFKQGAATITQITLPASGALVTFTLEVSPNGAADCDSSPDAEYSIRATGTYNPGATQIQKNDSSDLLVTCALVPSFTMSANPTSQSVAQGGTATYQVTVTSVNGFTDTVQLWQLITCPQNATCNYPPSVAVSPSSPGIFNFVVITTASTGQGSYNMQLSGRAQSDNSIQASVSMLLNVSGGPDYTFTVQPSPLNLDEGTSGTYTVTATPINGFSTPLLVTWSMVPTSGLITFTPTNSVLLNTGNSFTSTISVAAGTGSAGSYSLNFTATPQGSGTVKFLNGVQLVIGAVSCNGNCQNICVDGNNVPLVPNTFCPTGNECDTIPGARCAPQTCRATGCEPDPLPGPNDCNDSACYDASGNFIMPPASPTCYQSWPRCQAFDVLKVRKDRQCNKWLSCEDAVIFQDPIEKKDVSQCLNLGVCTQLGANGECASFLGGGNKDNIPVQVPQDLTGDSSKIRWLSGYSSGFHFTPSGNIEGTFPPQVIEEVGLDGARTNDLVRNGNFEELRCDGGPRDGLSCILPSDCRVGSGLCASNAATPNISSIPCQQDVDCQDADAGGLPTRFCRYFKTSSQEISCRNPLDAQWKGVVPRGGGSEAGLDGNQSDTETYGTKFNAAGQVAVRLMVREDAENFRTLSNNGLPAADSRHPSINGIVEDHLKDGNNYLRVAVSKEADRFSGVGVALSENIAPNSQFGYTLSFKFRYESILGITPDDIKAQLAFNYVSSGGTYASSTFVGTDFPIVEGTTQVSIPQTTEWKTFVLGPIKPGAFDGTLTAFLNFVTETDRNNDQPTVFNIDDVTLKPVLATADTQLSAADTKKIERRCRLYPRLDSPECDYFDQNGTRYKGWSGYCLDKDPQNQNLCITWWPLDLLAGETPFNSGATVGYDDRSPLYYCMQAEGGPLVTSVDWTVPRDSDGEVASDLVKMWWDSSGRVRYERDTEGDQTAYNQAMPPIRWRDIERVELLLNVNDDRWNGGPESQYKADVTGSPSGGSDYHIVLYQDALFGGVQQWGAGGFCKNGANCTSIGDGNFNNIWSKECNGGSDDQWAFIGVDVSNSDPNNLTAYLNGIRIHVCDDRSGNDLDNQITAKVVIYARQTCNVLTQTVQADNQNKAWLVRTDQGSGYTVPGLGFQYLNDSAPFGAVVPPSLSDPTSVDWNSTRTPDQLTTSALQSTEPKGNPRAGTPYTCRRDCGTTTDNTKYCYTPELPAGNCVPPNCGDLGFEPQYQCKNKADVDFCQLKADSYCVGRPLGRCSNNALRQCSIDGDCSGGTCSISDDAGSAAPIQLARERLKQLFAQNFGCWEAQVRSVSKSCGNSQWNCNYLEQYYVDSQLCNPDNPDVARRGFWDIAKDGPGDGVLYCSGARVDDPQTQQAEDYCAIRPDIVDDSFLIGGARSGNVQVALGTSVSGGFTYTVNDQQRPLAFAEIIWDWKKNGVVKTGYSADPETTCNGLILPRIQDSGVFSKTTTYTDAGTYSVLACVKDNWEAVGFQPFNGTVTAQ